MTQSDLERINQELQAGFDPNWYRREQAAIKIRKWLLYGATLFVLGLLGYLLATM